MVAKTSSRRFWNITHFLVVLAAAALGAISLAAEVTWLAVAMVVAVDAYLILVLVELAMRRKSREASARWLMDVPLMITNLPIVALLLIATLCSFAQMYIASDGVHYVVGMEPADAERERLRDRWNAIYFSTVTLTTSGYGDYVPVTRTARMLVVWNLFTTVLFLLGMLPLVISRIADFDTEGQLPG